MASALDEIGKGNDRLAMTDEQIKIARRRLILGITNVGFWVVVAVSGLIWLSIFPSQPMGVSRVLMVLVSVLAIQSLFDFVGGRILMPTGGLSAVPFLCLWGRGFFTHSLLLCGVGSLHFWSFTLFKSFCPSVGIGVALLFLLRRFVLRFVAGTCAKPLKLEGSSCWSFCAADPSFTGGVVGLGRNAMILVPELWRKELGSDQMQSLIQRRLWAIAKNLPARALACLVVWNLVGCETGSVIFEMPSRSVETAMLLQCCWMTFWTFLGLLVLPSLSRTAVLGADQAVAANGGSAGDWIRRFPNLTGEDGSSRTVLQRVFYPIPSAAERLSQLHAGGRLRVLGDLARTNLFLSLATLTILGRCVHCNVGRPELWIVPPAD